MYPRRLLREECWWWIDYLSLIHVDSFQGEQMMYMGGKNKLNKKDLQIHESNRYFHPITNNAILIELSRFRFRLTHLIYVFVFQMQIILLDMINQNKKLQHLKTEAWMKNTFDTHQSDHLSKIKRTISSLLWGKLAKRIYKYKA